jgi:hypothetical protein
VPKDETTSNKESETVMLLGGVRNWYRHDVSGSAELIDSFVNGVEKQVAESISRYEEGKKTELVEYDAGEDVKHSALIETHEGLESETWDLNAIFREYFPNLQRRSAFLTIYDYFENELDKLCLLYQSERGFRLSLRDLNEKGIDRSTSYLEKVAGLNLNKTSPEWNQVKALQKVRNIIVHRDGRLNAGEDKDIRSIITKLSQFASLSDEDEITLKHGFLSHVTNACKRYFKLIDQSIQASESLPKRHAC